MQELHDWLQTPSGQYVIRCEQAYFDRAVSDIFGFRAVQVGFHGYPFLRENRIPWQIVLSPETMPAPVAVLAYPEQLPFATQSLDLLLLPHTLDFCASPQQVLREAERVLMPEGRLILTGFNPYSLWGMKRRMKRCQGMPWQGRFVSLLRLRQWLNPLALEPCGGRFLCYAPPLKRQQGFERCRFMEQAGDRLWPVVSGVYALEIVKRVRGMRLIAPSWKTVPTRPLVAVSSTRRPRPAVACQPHQSAHLG